MCGGEERTSKFGMRTAMRGVMLAVRADVRMGNDSRHTKLLAVAGFKNAKNAPGFMQPTHNRLESGVAYANARKSPDQSRSKAEEKNIKTGKSRFY